MNYSTDRDPSPDHAIPPTPREELLRGETGRPTEPAKIVWPTPDPSLAGAGLEQLLPGDLRLPLLKLKQPWTPFASRVPEGSWFLTSDEEGHALSRGLVLLEARRERALLLPVHAGENAVAAACQRIEEETGIDVPPNWEGPVCWSRDLVRPVQQEGIPTLSEACASCPMSRWRTTPRGRRFQDCRECYRLLFWDMAADLPCVLYARGGGLRTAGELLTQLQVACHREELPAWGFVFGLSAKRLEGESGPYYVPVFSRPYPTTQTQAIERFAAVRRACAALEREEA